MKQLHLPNLIIGFLILIMSCDSGSQVDFSFLEGTSSIHVFAYGTSGKRKITEISKPIEIKEILTFLNDAKLKYDKPPIKWTPPREVAVFLNEAGKEIYLLWFGEDWISSQKGLDDTGAQKLLMTVPDMNKLRSKLRLKGV